MKKQKKGGHSTAWGTVVLILALAIGLGACKKDKPDEVVEEPVVTPAKAKKVFIINEGNFGSANASVSLFTPEDDKMVEDLYKAQNSSAMGDVAQSICKALGKYYVVLNNSAKIVVCDADFKKISEITSLGSPRYMLQVSATKAYVSDMYANGIHIVDLSTNTKTGSIFCSGWTEQMVLVKNKVYVADYNKDYVMVINPTNDQIVDSVFVGPGATNLVTDKNEDIWVLTSGNLTKTIFSRITKINSSNNIPVGTDLDKYFAGYLCANGKKDTLYFLNNGVYRFSVDAAPVIPALVIPNGTKSMYGLAVSPYDFNIYVSDAIDYTQRSSIYIYDVQGNQKKLLKAGINSNGFFFD